MDLEVTLYSFASITDKFLIKKFLELQDSFSKQILINLSNLLSDFRLRKNVSYFHLKNQDEIIKKIIFTKEVFVRKFKKFKFIL